MEHELLDEMARLLDRGERFALATLVDAHGSTPQKAGARMIVRADGTIAGTLGGGCIEAEVRDAAADVLLGALEPRLLHFELTEDIAVDYGLACGGNEHILIAPIAPDRDDASTIRKLSAAGPRASRGAVVTLVSGEGAPAGRMLAVRDDGTIDGRLGATHDEALAAARAVLADARTRPHIQRLASGAEMFVELLASPWEVVVVGAGHVGLAVATAAKFLGHRVAVIDDRPDFANGERFPDADVIVTGDIERSLAEYPVSDTSAIVVVTRGHKFDYQAVAIAARTSAFYVGLMGSRRKVTLIYRQLIDDGVPPERLREIYAPIGLNIGAVTPEEIAISIMAEITKARLGGDGLSLTADDRIIEKARARARA